MGSMREPIVLLVHDERLARNALRDLGLDTSTWESGLKGLLGYSTVKVWVLFFFFEHLTNVCTFFVARIVFPWCQFITTSSQAGRL